MKGVFGEDGGGNGASLRHGFCAASISWLTAAAVGRTGAPVRGS